MMTFTQMTDQIELILEDSGNAIFLAATIQAHIPECLKEVSNIFPYRVKEERITTASRDIDVSGVVNLIQVVEAEYKVDQYPKDLRNVTQWGDYITMDITDLPTASESVYLYCEKIHTLVDPPSSLAGAVNKSGGYSTGDSSIILDGLGTGVIKAGTLVTFASTAGEYKVTADATITANAATIVITPTLLEAVANDVVVTFRCSTLSDPRLESAFAEYVAAKLALNWVGTSRTQIKNAITAILLINSSVDSMTAKFTQITTDAGTARTAASANFATAIGIIVKAEASLNTDAEAALDQLSGDIEIGLGADGATVNAIVDLTNKEIDDALVDLDAGKALIVANLAAIATVVGEILTECDQAITDADSARALTNVVPVHGSPATTKLNTGAIQLSIVATKMKEIQALIQEGNIYNNYITTELNLAQAFLTEVKARMAVEAQLTSESALESRERIRLALGSLSEARTYISADAQKVANLYRVISTEAQTANGFLNQSKGYYSEVMADLSAARTIKNFESTATNRLLLSQRELKGLVKPETRCRHPRD